MKIHPPVFIWCTNKQTRFICFILNTIVTWEGTAEERSRAEQSGWLGAVYSTPLWLCTCTLLLFFFCTSHLSQTASNNPVKERESCQVKRQFRVTPGTPWCWCGWWRKAESSGVDAAMQVKAVRGAVAFKGAAWELEWVCPSPWRQNYPITASYSFKACNHTC